MEKNDNKITASRIEKLSSRQHELVLAAYWKQTEPSANQVRDRVTNTNLDWHAAGGLIKTAKSVTLDLARMEYLGEAFVYSDVGLLIVLKEDKKRTVHLTRLEDSFGEGGTRRTINRMFEKLEKPAKKGVDWRRLSMMFWMDVAWQIETGKWLP